MNLSARALNDAREVTAALLDELRLDAYLFEVEPRDGPWEVRVECAHADGWQTVVLAVDAKRLLATRTDPVERERLLENWGARLAACR